MWPVLVPIAAIQSRTFEVMNSEPLRSQTGNRLGKDTLSLYRFQRLCHVSCGP